MNSDSKIKELAIKGFNKEEIAKILKLKEEEIELIEETDIRKNSEMLYSALQKDLSKLVLTEMNKADRDTSVILNSIKLQAELQEKKLSLEKNKDTSKASTSYIYDRDKEIFGMKENGMSIEEISLKMKLSVLGVKQSLDRYNLHLPNELQTLPPSIISETITLDKDTRMKILWEAYNNNLTRKQIRDMVNSIKNNTR